MNLRHDSAEHTLEESTMNELMEAFSEALRLGWRSLIEHSGYILRDTGAIPRSHSITKALWMDWMIPRGRAFEMARFDEHPLTMSMKQANYSNK